MTVTDPYGDIGGSSINVNAFFNMDMTRDLNKTIGKESIQVGELNVSFIFSLMGFPEKDMSKNNEQNNPAFTYPGTEDSGMSD